LLIASCITVVDNSSSYELTRLFSVFFVYFAVEFCKTSKMFYFTR